MVVCLAVNLGVLGSDPVLGFFILEGQKGAMGGSMDTWDDIRDVF